MSNPPSRRTIPCRLSATACSIYSQFLECNTGKFVHLSFLYFMYLCTFNRRYPIHAGIGESTITRLHAEVRNESLWTQLIEQSADGPVLAPAKYKHRNNMAPLAASRFFHSLKWNVALEEKYLLFAYYFWLLAVNQLEHCFEWQDECEWCKKVFQVYFEIISNIHLELGTNERRVNVFRALNTSKRITRGWCTVQILNNFLCSILWGETTTLYE
jgi:hypothetical protein